MYIYLYVHTQTLSLSLSHTHTHTPQDTDAFDILAIPPKNQGGGGAGGGRGVSLAASDITADDVMERAQTQDIEPSAAGAASSCGNAALWELGQSKDGSFNGAHYV